MTTVRVDATGPMWSGQFCLHGGANWTSKEVCSSCTILLLHRMEAILKRLERGVVAPKFLALRISRSCTCLRRRILCPLGAVFCLSAAVFRRPLKVLLRDSLEWLWTDILLVCSWRRKVHNTATSRYECKCLHSGGGNMLMVTLPFTLWWFVDSSNVLPRWKSSFIAPEPHKDLF